EQLLPADAAAVHGVHRRADSAVEEQAGRVAAGTAAGVPTPDVADARDAQDVAPPVVGDAAFQVERRRVLHADAEVADGALRRPDDREDHPRLELAGLAGDAGDADRAAGAERGVAAFDHDAVRPAVRRDLHVE